MPCSRMPRRQRSTWFTCDSIMNTIEVWPSPAFGPTSMNRSGNPATLVPGYACGLPCQNVGERPAVRAPDQIGRRHVGDPETGGQNDGVHLPLGSVASDHHRAWSDTIGPPEGQVRGGGQLPHHRRARWVPRPPYRPVTPMGTRVHDKPWGWAWAHPRPGGAPLSSSVLLQNGAGQRKAPTSPHRAHQQVPAAGVRQDDRPVRWWVSPGGFRCPASPDRTNRRPVPAGTGSRERGSRAGLGCAPPAPGNGRTPS
jgi:hypothetical protein